MAPHCLLHHASCVPHSISSFDIASGSCIGLFPSGSLPSIDRKRSSSFNRAWQHLGSVSRIEAVQKRSALLASGPRTRAPVLHDRHYVNPKSHVHRHWSSLRGCTFVWSRVRQSQVFLSLAQRTSSWLLLLLRLSHLDPSPSPVRDLSHLTRFHSFDASPKPPVSCCTTRHAGTIRPKPPKLDQALRDPGLVLLCAQVPRPFLLLHPTTSLPTPPPWSP